MAPTAAADGDGSKQHIRVVVSSPVQCSCWVSLSGASRTRWQFSLMCFVPQWLGSRGSGRALYSMLARLELPWRPPNNFVLW